MARRRPFDEPWKRIIETLFPDFVALFMQRAHAEIDWSVPTKFLDKEFSRIARGARGGRRTADKLAEVRLLSGETAWVLIHVEVQAQRDDTLARRVFRYHLRIFDHFDREPVSLAILADPSPSWRPRGFGYARWGSSMRLEFPVAKLTDWTDSIEELASGANPFGIAVAAHLVSLATRGRPEVRMRERLSLYRALRRMGVSQDTASALWTFMDWVLDLPEELDDRFWHEVREEEESAAMRYVTRFEEKAEERGLRQGKALGLEEGKSLGILLGKAAGMRESLLFLLEGKFGTVPDAMRSRIEQITDTARLAQLMGLTLDVSSIEEMGI